VGLGALRQTCRDLGGLLEVASRPGLGTCLTLRIPLSRESTVMLPSSEAA
jgi:chemotaxis protein histidine kinase CheA